MTEDSRDKICGDNTQGKHLGEFFPNEDRTLLQSSGTVHTCVSALVPLQLVRARESPATIREVAQVRLLSYKVNEILKIWRSLIPFAGQKLV